MATFLNFEGTTDAAAFTTVGSTGADAIQNTSGSMEFDADIDYSSFGVTRSVRLVPSATSGANYASKTITATATASVVGVFNLPSPTASAGNSLLWVGTAGSTRAFAVGQDNTGKMALQNAAGTVIYTSTANIPSTGLVRFAVYGTSAGTIRAAMFSGTSTTPISGGDSGVLTGQSIGGANFNTVRWGKAATGTYAQVYNMGYCGWDTTAAFIDPPSGFSGTLSLTGSGTLTGTGAPGFTVSKGLTGSGTLTGAGTPAVTRSLSLSGSGALAGSAPIQAFGNLDLGGDGSLGVAQVQMESGTRNLTGSGTLSLTGKPVFTGALALGGSGQFDSGTPQVPSTTQPADDGGWWEVDNQVPGTATVLAGDLQTGLIRVRNIPAETGTVTTTLGEAGSIYATVKLPMIDPDTGVELPFDDLVQAGRSFLAIEYNGRILNAGPIWSDELNMDSGRLELRASGLRSYWDYRFVLPALSDTDMTAIPSPVPLSVTSSLQTIAKRIVQQAQSWTGGSVPVVFEADIPGTAVRTYPGYELHKVNEVLKQLSQVENGPDIEFRPRFASDPRYIEWTMQTGRPELVQNGPDHVWDTTVPTPAIQGATIRRDATVIATDNYQIGATPTADPDGDPNTPTPPLYARDYDSTLVTAGWPRMESSENRSTVTDVATLQTYANEATFTGRGAMETWTFQAKVDQAPLLVNYYEGDYAVIVTKDAPRLGTGRHRVRLMGLSMSLDSAFVTITCMPERVRV
jgi:hypothetical protein